MSRSHLHAQHFLRSPRHVAELIGHSNIRKNDVVYDLGAGSGVIASVLANKCKQVVAVELESEALKKLRDNLGNVENVTIIENDILTLVPTHESYKVFSNIPFNLSSQIIQRFVFDLPAPKCMYLIVQKQFARKLVPGDDHFTSLLSAEIGPFFSARIRKPLRKTDFTPPPAVDTVLLELKRREEPMLPTKETGRYREFIQKCFSEQKFFQSMPRADVGLSPELRPSQLTLEQWIALYKHISLAL